MINEDRKIPNMIFRELMGSVENFDRKKDGIRKGNSLFNLVRR